MTARFERVVLRTIDLAAARAFYGPLVGDGAELVELPAPARERGAPPHWLGHLGVDDVEDAAAALVARGATRLGPPPGTGAVAVLRDPGGAVVALAPRGRARGPEVAFYELAARDAASTAASYAALFGWELQPPVDRGVHGRFRPFAFRPGEPAAGAIGDVAGRPGVHPQWLFHFRVAALTPALDHVRAAGGLVLDPVALPGGERVAVCDDPQGAAFALRGPG